MPEQARRSRLRSGGETAKIIGYEGEIRWDPSRPNGTPPEGLRYQQGEGFGLAAEDLS